MYLILQLLGLDLLQQLELDTIGFPYLDQFFWNTKQSSTWAFEAAELKKNRV